VEGLECSEVKTAAVMMHDHVKWNDAAKLIMKGLEQAVRDGQVTYDLARLMKAEGRKDVTELSCSGFGEAIIARM
jgi:isocitrate dehydrogenase